jgi:hypothetical protein
VDVPNAINKSTTSTVQRLLLEDEDKGNDFLARGAI